MGLGMAMLAAAMVVVGVIALAVGRRTSQAVRALVHVDDLVVGRVPMICAITGEPTSELVQVESSRGGFQAWWLLLLFLGPVGIAVIAVLYVLGGRTDQVAGVLPISPAALHHYNSAVSVARRTMALLVVLVVGGFAALTLGDVGSSLPALVLGVAAGACVLVVFGASALAPSRWIDLRLDGSGRWVTVERVHPAFARAVHESYRNRDASHR